MLADVTIDGMVEGEFRRAIETLLREGNAAHAAKWLKSRLESVCGDGLPLPARFLTTTPADLTIIGWSELADRIERLDALGSPVTAISIDLAPDPSGRTMPHIETRFYTDDSWAFSHCDRAGLLMGYEGWASRWTGRFAHVDNTIGIEGIDDLYGAVVLLDQICRPAGTASDLQHRAYMLGASYIAVLVHLAVRDTALERGLPRRLAVLVGSNESYPFFDAPVIPATEALICETPVVDGTETPRAFASPESAEDYRGVTELRELTHPDADPGQEAEAWSPPQESHLSGTQLRKRIVTDQSIAELENTRKPSLLQRILGRK